MREMNEKELRQWLRDYYGTAMCGGYGAAMMELARVERADVDELIKMARKAGLDIRR